MRYQPIIALSVRHDYYTDSRCPDFTIEPTQRTAELLKNHRLVMRVTADGIEISSPLDDEGAMFIALDSGATLDFSLQLRNADFALFTDLTELDALRRDIVEAKATRRDELLQTGTYLAATFAKGAGDTLALTVRETLIKPPSDAFAMVELTYDGTAGKRYRIEFNSSNPRWSYYCLSDLPVEAGDLSIVDQAASDTLSFDASIPEASDVVATRLAQDYPDHRRLRFVSQQPVPTRSAPRKQLELQLDGNRVAGPLPNPMLSSISTVTLSDGVDPVEHPSLYHVLKYPNRPTPSTGG